jgi:hypothetical protein
MLNPDLMNAIAGALPGACSTAGANGDWTAAASAFLVALEARSYTVVPQITPPPVVPGTAGT